MFLKVLKTYINHIFVNKSKPPSINTLSFPFMCSEYYGFLQFLSFFTWSLKIMFLEMYQNFARTPPKAIFLYLCPTSTCAYSKKYFSTSLSISLYLKEFFGPFFICLYIIPNVKKTKVWFKILKAWITCNTCIDHSNYILSVKAFDIKKCLNDKCFKDVDLWWWKFRIKPQNKLIEINMFIFDLIVLA